MLPEILQYLPHGSRQLCHSKVVTVVANRIYTPDFKKKIVRLHEVEGCTYKSIAAEYGVSEAGISKWYGELRDECQKRSEIKEEYDSRKENLRLKKENDELSEQSSETRRPVENSSFSTAISRMSTHS